MKTIIVLLLALALAGCRYDNVIPPYFLPHRDHTLQCEGDLDTGECSERIAPGMGSL